MTKKSPTRRKLSSLVTILACALLIAVVQSCPKLVYSKPLVSSSSTTKGGNAAPDGNDNDNNANHSELVEYKHAKGGLGKIVSWGLAKIENAIYGDVNISDLIAAFVAKFDNVLAIMVRSFAEIMMPYEKLLVLEKERLVKFDSEFKDLVGLRNKIERKCSRVTTIDDRSLCVDRGVDIRGKIDDLRDKRSRSIDAISRYEGMIEWCASYGNWFC
jgi:hypothetical protein